MVRAESRYSSGVSVGIPLTVGAGWNRALADVTFNILIKYYLYKRR